MEALYKALELLHSYLEMPLIHGAVVLGSFVCLAFFVWLFMTRSLLFLARKTETKLDDLFVESLRNPVTFTILVVGVRQTIDSFSPPEAVAYATQGVLMSALVLLWMTSLRRVFINLLREWSFRPNAKGIVRPQTLPLMTLFAQSVVYLCAMYFLFKAWGMDATAWLASAGILGVAVGFGAQNTVSDLLSGMAIMMDPPFEVGDYVELESGKSGRVREIGFRCTRFWTLDDMEVVLPNSVITASQVTNASKGPKSRERLRIPVSLRYDEDRDLQVKLLAEGALVEGVVESPGPEVRMLALGSYGIEYVINVWIEKSEDREPIRDRVIRSVLRSLESEGLSIPFPKHELLMEGNTVVRAIAEVEV